MPAHRFAPALAVAVGSVLVVALIACDPELTEPQPEPPTFARIQTEIFAVSCTSCHGGATPRAGMRLEADSAYAHLVGVTPRRAGAVAAGLLRVTPGDPLNSLLFHKLAGWDSTHHAPADYGNPMPSGQGSLSYGQIEYIRRWIVAGAPRTGSVVDPAVLRETRLPVHGDF